jgi:quercetin dioxygenase-like cupin family protein
MGRKLTSVSCIAAIAVVLVYHVESARATPAVKFTGTTLVKGTFAGFQVFNHFTQDQLQQLAPGFPANTWLSFQKTEGPSDLYIQSNTWQPGGSSGWHQHPGHSLITVTAGEVTQYHANCVPQVYGPLTANGPTLVDTGHEEHVIRNEGSIVATSYAVQIVPTGAPRRIDQPAPDSCQIF